MNHKVELRYCTENDINKLNFAAGSIGDLCIFVNSEIITSYIKELPEDVKLIESMLSYAFNAGLDMRSREIRELINA